MVARMARKRPQGDPSVCVAYYRTSTAEQAYGIDAQRAAVLAHVERVGGRLAAEHEDRASGTLDVAARPSLLAALADLRAHGAGTLVVARRDRIARDVVVAGVVERLASAAGARIVSAAGEGSDDGSPSGQFLRAVIDAASQFEGASIRARTRAALAAMRARGLRTGGLPWGFAAGPDGTLVPDAGERRTLDRVRELRAIGHTIDEATGVLRREGYLSRRGTPLTRSRVGALWRLAATEKDGQHGD